MNDVDRLIGRVCCDSCEGSGVERDYFDEDHYIESNCSECGGLGHVEDYKKSKPPVWCGPCDGTGRESKREGFGPLCEHCGGSGV